MTTKKLSLISLFILGTGFSACNKEELIDVVSLPQEKNTFQIVIDTLPEGNSYDTSDLFAYVSIVNDKNEQVLNNKKLSVSFNGKYVIEKVQLDAGNYRVSSFILAGASGITRFATPIANSPRASEVHFPLSVNFKLQNADLLDVPLEVSKLQKDDKSESFGYPAGTFKIPNSETGTFVKVKLQAIITVGDITYDNIPAQFSIIIRNAQGGIKVLDTLLQGGINELHLSATGVKYQFKLNKWGISDELSLDKDQLKEGEIYTLGGAKAAKKLRLEEQFTLTSSGYVPSGKSVYTYNSEGKIQKIDFYDKLPQYSDLRLSWSKVYVYTNGKLNRINYMSNQGAAFGYLELTYNSNGTKIVAMKEISYDQSTDVKIEYTYPSGYAQINFDYVYANGKGLEYNLKIKDGNKVEDYALGTSGGENGTYRYDFNINPYAHINLPNLYLSNLSRNNLVDQQKNYAGSIPSVEPYKFEYTYDEDGYPKVLLKSFKSYSTGDHLFKIKTEYTY